MTIVKRSLTIAGHRTSLSLEPAFWAAFRAEAEAQGLSLNALAAAIDEGRAEGESLSSAVRVHLLRLAQGRSGPAP